MDRNWIYLQKTSHFLVINKSCSSYWTTFSIFSAKKLKKQEICSKFCKKHVFLVCTKMLVKIYNSLYFCSSWIKSKACAYVQCYRFYYSVRLNMYWYCSINTAQHIFMNVFKNHQMCIKSKRFWRSNSSRTLK